MTDDSTPLDLDRSPMTVDEALEYFERWRVRGMTSPSERTLAEEVRRLRALFGGFQLECCDDWTCAQDHARRAGEVIAGLRAKLERAAQLPAKWRKESNDTYEIESVTTDVLAKELEAAIGGEA